MYDCVSFNIQKLFTRFSGVGDVEGVYDRGTWCGGGGVYLWVIVLY